MAGSFSSYSYFPPLAMTNPKIINSNVRCPACGAQGEYMDGMLWVCSWARGFRFEADAEVEIDSSKYDLGEIKVIKNGKIEMIKTHILKDETKRTTLSELNK